MSIGIQDFEKLRTENFVYVDKTAWVYHLAAEGNPCFLGRPRRFGKSLLLSTFKAYFEGKRHLFEALAQQPRLAIADMEKDWISYPVFHIDFNPEQYDHDISGLMNGINSNLRYLEDKWGANPLKDRTPAGRLRGLISRAYEKTGRKVVVLIDEYDKPLNQTIYKPELQKEIRGVLKSFYGVFKTADPMLRFVFLTGVTKFSQISVFSDLNQLRDISMLRAYSEVCGISVGELADNFKPELEALAQEKDKTYDEILAEMQKWYKGYHFSKESEGMFNPFSVLNTLANQDFASYWFKTGTSTSLGKSLKKFDFDLRRLSEGITINLQSIDDYRADGNNLTPLLYQSGYLTIKDYNPRFNEYTLAFPNAEVTYGFLNELLLLYAPQTSDEPAFFVSKFFRDLLAGDVGAFMNRLKTFLANIPDDPKYDTEKYYQNILYLLFTLMGQYTQLERRSVRSRADMVVRADSRVFVFEFKLADHDSEELADAALAQISDTGYLIPYSAGNRDVVKIGAVFNKTERTLGCWKSFPG